MPRATSLPGLPRQGSALSGDGAVAPPHLPRPGGGGGDGGSSGDELQLLESSADDSGDLDDEYLGLLDSHLTLDGAAEAELAEARAMHGSQAPTTPSTAARPTSIDRTGGGTPVPKRFSLSPAVFRTPGQRFVPEPAELHACR